MAHAAAVPVDLLDLHLRQDKMSPFITPAAEIGWDEKLGVFATLTARASREAFASECWHAVRYGSVVETLSDRLNIVFDDSKLALDHLPLAAEGDRHRELRRTFAQHLSSRTVALSGVIDEFVAERVQLLARKDEVDLMADLVVPLVDQVNFFLSDAPAVDGEFSISRIFDALIGVRSRQKIEQSLKAMHSDMAGRGLDQDDVVGRAMVLHVLSGDSLAGTIGNSLQAILAANEGRALSEIEFPEGFVDTSVPYIERCAQADTVLCGHAFQRDSRIRVYLLPFLTGEGDVDPVGIFGHGRHVCLGKRISIIVWRSLIGQLGAIDRIVSAVTCKPRAPDYVFSFPATLTVSLR